MNRLRTARWGAIVVLASSVISVTLIAWAMDQAFRLWGN